MKKGNKGLRDTPRSMPNSQAYRDGWDKIFRNDKENKRDDKKPMRK